MQLLRATQGVCRSTTPWGTKIFVSNHSIHISLINHLPWRIVWRSPVPLVSWEPKGSEGTETYGDHFGEEAEYGAESGEVGD